MGLLRRIERAQQGTDTPSAESPSAGTPNAAAQHPAAQSTGLGTRISPPAAPTRGQLGARESILGAIRLRILDDVIGASASIFTADSETEVRSKIEGIVDQTLHAKGSIVSRDERMHLIDDVVAEATGFGPLEPLLRDETVTEVMVNGPRQIYIERKGKLVKTDVVFRNDEHVMHIIDRIIAPLGRRIDDSSPRVDARLPDGSRVNAIIAPLSLIGPVITVRKFSATPYTVENLVGFGTATAEMFDFLRVCVEVRLNIFVSGGTGSGKTTFLNVLSSCIPEEQRIVTIEDAAELQLSQAHVVTLEARPSNLEGEGEITIRDLLRNALHMRPDRIIVGECRGGEALDMIQAMTVGHAGSLSTGHANTPADMLRRLETMILMTGYELPLRAIREQIASGVDLIVHTGRLKDGSRKVLNITEVYGMEEDEILIQDIFRFEQTGFTDGKVEGQLKPTGIRPTFMWKFADSGIQLPAGDFGIPPEDPKRPDRARYQKGRSFSGEGVQPLDASIAFGRATSAGGMIYVSSMGPVDPDTGLLVAGGIAEQTSQCIRNLKERLEAEGSSLSKIVWATWSLRDAAEFDAFNKEWARWFSGVPPIGQGTLLPPLQRRAGFLVSIGAIAEA